MDRLPPWLWLALTVACLTPVWLWSTARFTDGSDDPLGIVALITLVVLLARDRQHFSERPSAGWLLLTFALAAAAVLGGTMFPALVRGVLGVLAVCTALWAVRAPGQPMLALTGLGLLALPLISSLQYFVGYPLRVVTAEASRWLLSLFGADIEREGSALAVAGRLVIVDAPCSGIQMAWVAYFTACAVAALWRLPDLHFLRRVPLVGATVLAGNIVRNTLLVLKEAQLVQWPDWTHEAIGLVVTGLVCLLVQWQMTAGSRAAVIGRESRFTQMFGYRSPLDTWARMVAFTGLSVLLLWPWVQPAPVAASAVATAVEWPLELEGRPLRPLVLSAVEQRFADRFPGAIARFTDGESAVVLRHVTTPTRMLHPAEDCYRGLGYRVLSQALEREASGGAKLRRCMIVEKKGRQLRVCENIVDAQGQTFTDTSAWYWAAVMGRSQGPWLAVTKAVMR
jgi:exosortase/archaeosortase family protein